MRRALAALVLLAGLLAGCGGPRPEVRSAEVRATATGKAVVTVVVANGGGSGQIELKVTLRDSSGTVVAREERTLDLEDRESATAVMELDVPDGVGGLQVHAVAVYPPD